MAQLYADHLPQWRVHPQGAWYLHVAAILASMLVVSTAQGRVVHYINNTNSQPYSFDICAIGLPEYDNNKSIEVGSSGDPDPTANRTIHRGADTATMALEKARARAMPDPKTVEENTSSDMTSLMERRVARRRGKEEDATSRRVRRVGHPEPEDRPTSACSTRRLLPPLPRLDARTAPVRDGV